MSMDSRTLTDYPTGTDTTFAYDSAGRQISMVDATGTSSFTYDNASQVTALTTPQGSLTYGYDAAGRRTSQVQTGVGTTTYGYDAASRITSLTNPYSEVTSYTYDNANRTTKQTVSSGVYTDYGYDTRSRLTSLTHKNSGGTVLSTESYSFDNASNMSSKTVDGVTTTYTYDNHDQITGESRTGYAATYTYDANGNRATRVLNGVTQTYTSDNGDKLTAVTWSGGSKTYGYDAAGRTTSVVTGAGTTTLSYDYEGRVTGISYPGGGSNSFTYNGLDTRVGKVDSGGTKTFMRSGVGVTDPVLSDSAAVYTPGVSERRGSTSKFYGSNHLGTNTVETDSTQAVSATKIYDAFGSLVSSTGSSASPFGFAGKEGYQEDMDSGLKLLGHRYYDSSTGRFITRDPIKDGRNWYTYCRNNPNSLVDGDGYECHDPSHIIVDKDFDGKVWVIGEPGVGKPQIILPVPPGGISPPKMDVDLVVIQYKNGKQRRFFLRGTDLPPRFGGVLDVDSYYAIIKGKSIGIPRVIQPLIGPLIIIPATYEEFYKGKRRTYPKWQSGGDGSGAWNQDIEDAKGGPGSKV